MKIKNILFFTVALICVNAANAAKLAVIQGIKASPKHVTIFWKEGSQYPSSGWVDLPGGGSRTVLSSPWNKDIVGVQWYESSNNNDISYEYPLHVSAMRGPWAKDAWLVIENGGSIQFDLGKGVQNHKVIPMHKKAKLEEEGWAVID